MAFIQYLVFDGTALPLPDSYEVEMKDVVRLGVVSIQADFSVSPKWLKVLSGFKQKEKIGVEYFDTESLEMRKTEMYIEGYKARLVKDTSFKGLWKVSFTLREF